MTRDEVLTALREAMDARTAAEDAIFDAVEAARDAGVTWSEVAEAIGVQPQEARAWIGPMVDRGGPLS